jgi:two-component system sensor histidine kinase HydH
VTLATRPLRDGPLAGGAAIRVEDTGCGIPEADLQRIWDPFWTTKTRGSGLGLAVVRRIVEAHGGEIRAESRPQGTVFEVLLPLFPPARPPRSSEQESRS